MKEIVHTIQEYCKKNHISIYSFEEKAGIGNGTIAKWSTSNPSLSSLEKISKITGISLGTLARQSKEIVSSLEK